MKKINKDFLDIIEKIYSKDDIKIIEDGFKTLKRKTVFRVNTLKTTNEEIESYLQENKIKFKKIDFLKNAYLLEELEEKDLWHLDIFTEGKIYLQSISSQIPVELLNIRKGDNILDVAASPGGKTSQAASMLENSGEIIAIDNNAIRIDKLNFTLKRQGVKNTRVFKLDSRRLLEDFPDLEGHFDKIIADLPCSAEGKFNLNNEKSYSFWNTSISKKNYKLQKEIIKSIIPLLKEGGELIYSTCTINPYENEDIVHMILSNFPELKLEEIKIDFEFIREGITGFENKIYKKEMKKTLRILPSVLSEGFFVAKMTKQKLS